jgi:hypothetical protein
LKHSFFSISDLFRISHLYFSDFPPLGQLHRNLLVEDLADGMGHDHLAGSLEKAADLRRNVSSETEGDAVDGD